jgi:hypothetical protein
VLVAQGDAVAAAEHLTPGMAGSDPEARLGLVELLLRGGKAETAVDLAAKTIAESPETGEAIARLAGIAVAHVPEPALALLDIAIRRWTEQAQWEPAASALQQFVARAPGCIDALVRLVEVAVDGDLMSTAAHAQEMLADAYLATGALAEGLAIAEDLAAREPGNPVHLARLRQARELTRGDAAGGAIDADRQTGQSTVLPFRMSAAS